MGREKPGTVDIQAKLRRTEKGFEILLQCNAPRGRGDFAMFQIKKAGYTLDDGTSGALTLQGKGDTYLPGSLYALSFPEGFAGGKGKAHITLEYDFVGGRETIVVRNPSEPFTQKLPGGMTFSHSVKDEKAQGVVVYYEIEDAASPGRGQVLSAMLGIQGRTPSGAPIGEEGYYSTTLCPRVGTYRFMPGSIDYSVPGKIRREQETISLPLPK